MQKLRPPLRRGSAHSNQLTTGARRAPHRTANDAGNPPGIECWQFGVGRFESDLIPPPAAHDNLPRPLECVRNLRVVQPRSGFDIDNDGPVFGDQEIVRHMLAALAINHGGQREGLRYYCPHCNVEVRIKQARQFEPRFVGDMRLHRCRPVEARVMLLSVAPAEDPPWRRRREIAGLRPRPGTVDHGSIEKAPADVDVPGGTDLDRYSATLRLPGGRPSRYASDLSHASSMEDGPTAATPTRRYTDGRISSSRPTGRTVAKEFENWPRSLRS